MDKKDKIKSKNHSKFAYIRSNLPQRSTLSSLTAKKVGIPIFWSATLI